MAEQNELYTIKLHERATISPGITALRVPGGWIYEYWNAINGQRYHAIFVPYSNEFMETKF